MKIRYITSHGAAEMIEFDAGERDTLLILTESRLNGAVVLGGKLFTLVSGRAEIPLSTLPDGEYAPSLETEDGIFTAECFTKNGRGITPAAADEKLIRRLLMRCYSLENEMLLAKERIEKLEAACSGHNIFDFERKEK